MYTYGWNAPDDVNKENETGSNCSCLMVQSVYESRSSRGNRSSHKWKTENRKDSISFNRKISLPSDKVTLRHGFDIIVKYKASLFYYMLTLSLFRRPFPETVKHEK